MSRARLFLAVVVAAATAPWVADTPSAAQVGRRGDEARIATISFLDVGQGDSVLIRSPEGKTALIDAGPSKGVVETLRNLGVDHLDMVAISHHHADHYGGMDDVIRAFKPRVFLATDSGHTTPTYLRLLELVRESRMQAIMPQAEARKVTLGSVDLTILPQPPESNVDENDNSIGIRVRHGSITALLTGDSEGPERAWWLANCPELIRDAPILKLSHHGSRNGADRRWVALVRPRLAVASVGRNSYGHPDGRTLEMVAESGARVVRTDLDGTITVASDGKRWSVEMERASARAPPAVAKGRQDRPDSRRKPREKVERAEAGKDLVDLNTASQAELEALPGIGPILAKRIIEGRPYASADDLDRVKGIGPKKLAELRPLVRVGQGR